MQWHMVRDLPNAAISHIRLKENDNRPVTKSRDTQEVNPAQARRVARRVMMVHLPGSCQVSFIRVSLFP